MKAVTGLSGRQAEVPVPAWQRGQMKSVELFCLSWQVVS